MHLASWIELFAASLKLERDSVYCRSYNLFNCVNLVGFLASLERPQSWHQGFILRLSVLHVKPVFLRSTQSLNPLYTRVAYIQKLYY